MSSKLNEYKDSIERNLTDKSKPWTKYFEMAEEKSGVNRVYLFVGLVAFTGLYLVFGFGAELICNSIGFVYPAYMSMKALESPQKDDDTKWLTYWVVYACFSIVEYFSDFIVGWFPLYWLVKIVKRLTATRLMLSDEVAYGVTCLPRRNRFNRAWPRMIFKDECIFVIWCYLPTEFNGSLIIYNRIIRPYYQKHHGRIDDMANSDLDKILKKVEEKVDKTVKAFGNTIKELHKD